MSQELKRKKAILGLKKKLKDTRPEQRQTEETAPAPMKPIVRASLNLLRKQRQKFTRK